MLDRCRGRRRAPVDAHTSIGRDRARPAIPAGSAGPRGAAGARSGRPPARYRGARRPGGVGPAAVIERPTATRPGPQPTGGRLAAVSRPASPPRRPRRRCARNGPLPPDLPSMPTCKAARSAPGTPIRQPDQPHNSARGGVPRVGGVSTARSALLSGLQQAGQGVIDAPTALTPPFMASRAACRAPDRPSAARSAAHPPARGDAQGPPAPTLRPPAQFPARATAWGTTPRAHTHTTGRQSEETRKKDPPGQKRTIARLPERGLRV